MHLIHQGNCCIFDRHYAGCLHVEIVVTSLLETNITTYSLFNTSDIGHIPSHKIKYIGAEQARVLDSFSSNSFIFNFMDSTDNVNQNYGIKCCYLVCTQN